MYNRYTCDALGEVLLSYTSLEMGKVFGKVFEKPLGNEVGTQGSECLLMPRSQQWCGVGGVIMCSFTQQKDEKLEISIGTSEYEGTVSKRAGFGKPHNPLLFPCRLSLDSASDSVGSQPIIRNLKDPPL